MSWTYYTQQGKASLWIKWRNSTYIRKKKKNNQINDKNTVKQNAIFDDINSHDPRGAIID
jgi:hypothetical protein